MLGKRLRMWVLNNSSDRISQRAPQWRASTRSRAILTRLGTWQNGEWNRLLMTLCVARLTPQWQVHVNAVRETSRKQWGESEAGLSPLNSQEYAHQGSDLAPFYLIHPEDMFLCDTHWLTIRSIVLYLSDISLISVRHLSNACLICLMFVW